MTKENILLVGTSARLSDEELLVSKSEVFDFIKSKVKSYKNRFVVLGVLVILQAVIVGFSIWLLKYSIDYFFEAKKVSLLIFALFLATVGKSSIDFLYNWIQNLTIANIRDRAILDSFKDLVESPFKFHIQERNQRKYGWILKDASALIESSFGLLQVWIRQPLQMISSIIAVATISWSLTLIGLVTIPLLAPCFLYFRKKTAVYIAKRKMLLGRVEERISESIYGIRIIKAFGLEERECNRIEKVVSEQRNLNQKNAFHLGLAGPMSESIGLLSLILILLVGVNSIFSSMFTPGTFLAFIFAFTNIYKPFKGLSNGALLYQTAIDAGRRLVLLSRRSQSEEFDLQKEEVDFFHQVEYKNISFSYKNDSGVDVLNNISFKIYRGETILLTGPSGAGKSTLCDLLFKLYQANTGEILVDDIPLNRLSKQSHRKLFAMCSQEAILFSDTLLENIRIARPDSSLEEVKIAASIAQVPSKLIARLDDMVGDRGLMLSGGEKQRIALARAILCKPQFMLLDEALNSLDPETESKIWKNLRVNLPDTTFLVVSHRWMDLDQYDRLILMANGKIIENTKIRKGYGPLEVMEKYKDKI